MPLSNTVLRRYTPPTCTLEVWAESSPLSRWTKKSVLRQLSFELRFDDPRLSEAQKITIQGDRDQLEALCTMVSNYVQELLQKTPESFWMSHFPSSETFQNNNQSQLETVLDSKSGNRVFNSGFSQKPGVNIPGASISNIYLQPATKLNHQLFLGSLENATSGSVIYLSQLQLFDLASALEEYSAEAVTLPPVQSNSQAFSLPVWAPAAAVMVAALGLAPLTWRYANNVRQEYGVANNNTSSTPEIAADEPTNRGTDLESLPSPVPTSTSPGILGTQTLVSPPPVSNVPSNSATPFPNSNISGVTASPKTTFPSVNQSSSQIATSTQPPSPSGNIRLPGGNLSNLPLSPNLKTSRESPQIAIKPNIGKNNTASNFQGGSLKTKPGSLPKINNSPVISNQPPSLPDLSANSSIAKPSIRTNSKTSALIRQLQQQSSNNNSPSTTSSPKVATSSETLFDTNQVVQVREYFKKRWQPPAGLKQTLEYSLKVGVDGTIEEILPLGGAARDYVNSTGMPAIGTPFVNPSKSGQNTRIRTVFSPNGKVQAFPETD
ncbi:MAG: DUF4335 domain-containing protein [Cyanobacteria bacterium P01_A01_bin.84]